MYIYKVYLQNKKDIHTVWYFFYACLFCWLKNQKIYKNNFLGIENPYITNGWFSKVNSNLSLYTIPLYKKFYNKGLRLLCIFIKKLKTFSAKR